MLVAAIRVLELYLALHGSVCLGTSRLNARGCCGVYRRGVADIDWGGAQGPLLAAIDLHHNDVVPATPNPGVKKENI